MSVRLFILPDRPICRFIADVSITYQVSKIRSPFSHIVLKAPIYNDVVPYDIIYFACSGEKQLD